MNRSETSSSGALKTTIHLGKTLVATQGASTFYCMNRELPEPSPMLGSNNLLVTNGLDLTYIKLASKRSKPSITASLGGVTALPAASQLRSSFILGSSLLELVERPPILGKELERFGQNALSSFRVHPGPLPPNASKLFTALIDPPPIAPSPLSVPPPTQPEVTPLQNSASARPVPSTPLSSISTESKPTIRSAPTPVSHGSFAPAVGTNTQVVFTQNSSRTSTTTNSASHHSEFSKDPLEQRKRKKRDESRGALLHASGLSAGSRSAGPSPSVPNAAPPHTPNIPSGGSTTAPRPASAMPPSRPSPLGAPSTATASPMKSAGGNAMASASASASASAGGAAPKPAAPAAHSRPPPQNLQGAPPAAHQHSHSAHAMHGSQTGAPGGAHYPSPAKRGRPANHQPPTSSMHFSSAH